MNWRGIGAHRTSCSKVGAAFKDGQRLGRQFGLPSIRAQASLHRNGDVPSQNWRNGVPYLPFGLPQLGLEDEAVREGLQSGCLPHGPARIIRRAPKRSVR